MQPLVCVCVFHARFFLGGYGYQFFSECDEDELGQFWAGYFGRFWGISEWILELVSSIKQESPVAAAGKIKCLASWHMVCFHLNL